MAAPQACPWLPSRKHLQCPLITQPVAGNATPRGGVVQRQPGICVWGDWKRLRATSPAVQAERIRVPVQQSEAVTKALKRAGKCHRHIEQEGGSEQLSQYSHRLEFFQALEVFLDERPAGALK